MAITFDGAERLITLTAGTVELDVVDLYSRWKDYVKTTDGGKFAPAFAPLGGDPIDPGAGTTVPLYAFLVNGWRVRPQEASHTLAVTSGILLVDGGGDPFVDTLGSFIVRINYQQPVQAIKVETGTSGLTPEESAALTALDDRLPASLVGGKMNSTLDSGEQEAIAAAILDLAGGVESTATVRQALRLMLAALAGKTSGQGAAPVFRNVGDTKDRITATVDVDGNRTAVTVDAA